MSVEPREPATVEKRTNTGVCTAGSCSGAAIVSRGLALIDLEEAVRGGAAGMDDPLGNALVVEVRDLLAHQDVFEQRRTAHVRLRANSGRR